MSIADMVYLDDTGFHYPDYPTTLKWYQDQYRLIYGADVYLEADSQDGQWIAVQAQAAYDTFALAAAVIASYPPSSATGVTLSRNVKINGLRRKIPGRSSCDVVIIGQAGATITNGQIRNRVTQSLWNLPPQVIIPLTGSIVVTCNADDEGAITASTGDLTIIVTPTRGWQSVSNPAPAVEGQPVESDPQLRQRQRLSTALPSLTVMDGIVGAVYNIDGVSRVKGYENDTKVPDSNGLPGNSISLVVEGGDIDQITQAIAVKKTPGGFTFGDQSRVIFDKYGMPNTISFFRVIDVPIYTKIYLVPLTGYTTGYDQLIAASVSSYYNSLDIGDEVRLSKIFNFANLPGTEPGTTFDIQKIEISTDGIDYVEANISLAFKEAAEGINSNVLFEYV